MFTQTTPKNMDKPSTFTDYKGRKYLCSYDSKTDTLILKRNRK